MESTIRISCSLVDHQVREQVITVLPIILLPIRLKAEALVLKRYIKLLHFLIIADKKASLTGKCQKGDPKVYDCDSFDFYK